MPTANSSGQFKQGWVTPEGKFQVQQVAPGDYRVFAFERPQQDLEYATEEALRRYDSQSQVITVAAEQKKTLRLSLIAGSE